MAQIDLSEKKSTEAAKSINNYPKKKVWHQFTWRWNCCRTKSR